MKRVWHSFFWVLRSRWSPLFDFSGSPGRSTNRKQFRALDRCLTWPSRVSWFCSVFLYFFISRVPCFRGSDLGTQLMGDLRGWVIFPWIALIADSIYQPRQCMDAITNQLLSGRPRARRRSDADGGFPAYLKQRERPLWVSKADPYSAATHVR